MTVVKDEHDLGTFTIDMLKRRGIIGTNDFTIIGDLDALRKIIASSNKELLERLNSAISKELEKL